MGFLHSTSAGIKRLLQFFMYPTSALTMSSFTATMSALKFQNGLHCPDLISPPPFTFLLNLRGWENGGGRWEDLTELWNISEQSLGKAAEGVKNRTLLSAGVPGSEPWVSCGHS